MPRRGVAQSALLVVVLLTGCATTDPRADGNSTAATSDAAETTRPTGSAGPLPALDAERQTALLADGLEEGEAEFLALTQLESEVLDEHTYRVLITFPTGDQGELTVALAPDQVGDPTVSELTHEETDDEFRFRLAYVVPWDVIPADLHDDIREGGTAVAVDAILAAAPAQVAADSAGVGVVVTGLLKQIYNQSTSEAARILEERFRGTLDVSTTLRMLRALEAVGNALTTSADYLDVVHQLDEIEECVRNPTNPITQRAYRDDPGYQQRVLDQVAATRSEVKANAAVLYLSHLIKTGSSLVRNVPALGFIVGPGTAWSKAALNDVTRKLIEDLRKNVPACEAIGLDFHAENIPLRTASIDTSSQINVTGHIDICPTEDGAGFIITGSYHDETHGGGVSGRSSDFNLLELSGRPDPETFTVVLSEFETPEEHIATYSQFTFTPSSIAIRDAGSEHPTGIFSLRNGFDDHVGDFPLTVTPVEPTCPTPAAP